jgi:hypothetical protein
MSTLLILVLKAFDNFYSMELTDPSSFQPKRQKTTASGVSLSSVNSAQIPLQLAEQIQITVPGEFFHFVFS